MTSRVQTQRLNAPGSRPTGRTPGELYVNFPDRQVGVMTSPSATLDLVGVRFFSTTTSYAIGDHVIQGGLLYRAIAAVTPGAFNATKWVKLASVTDLSTSLSAYLPLTGGIMTGVTQLKGINDASEPNVNIVGEFLSTIRSAGLALTTNTFAVVTQVSVNAGDWEIGGELWLTTPTVGNVSILVAGIGPVSANIPSTPDLASTRATVGLSAAAATHVVHINPIRANVTTITPYYLNVVATFATGTASAFGKIWARRMR